MMADHPGDARASVDPEVVEMLRVARELRDLPSSDFKANLKADLERKAIMMSTKTAVARPGFHTITPYLLPQGLEFIDFLKSVFDAVETFRAEAGPGRFHAEVRIGDSMVMVGGGSGRKMPAGISVYVPNVDEVYKRAVDAGCVELQPVQNAHWEPIRFGCVQDQEGNGWSIVTHLGKSYIPEGHHSISAGFAVKGAAQFIDFLKQAFDAQEIQRWEWPGGLFASFRIGDSVVGVSESTNHEWMRPMTTMINMYVPDCDTLYEKALRAGAKSISPVADQPYGVRSGAVEDAWGNQWFIATPL
jgi:PhnB protein